MFFARITDGYCCYIEIMSKQKLTLTIIERTIHTTVEINILINQSFLSRFFFISTRDSLKIVAQTIKQIFSHFDVLFLENAKLKNSTLVNTKK